MVRLRRPQRRLIPDRTAAIQTQTPPPVEVPPAAGEDGDWLVVQRQSNSLAAEMPDAWLQRIAAAALAAAGEPSSPVEATLLLADDATLHDLNARFRNVDKPTDVLSFGQDGGTTPVPVGQPHYLGDIAISVERAQRQAMESSHSFARELGYLLVHGVLHLCGFDHESDTDQAAMRRVEEDALATMGLSHPPESP